jgi:hypothetical protein
MMHAGGKCKRATSPQTSRPVRTVGCRSRSAKGAAPRGLAPAHPRRGCAAARGWGPAARGGACARARARLAQQQRRAAPARRVPHRPHAPARFAERSRHRPPPLPARSGVAQGAGARGSRAGGAARSASCWRAPRERPHTRAAPARTGPHSDPQPPVAKMLCAKQAQAAVATKAVRAVAPRVRGARVMRAGRSRDPQLGRGGRGAPRRGTPGRAGVPRPAGAARRPHCSPASRGRARKIRAPSRAAAPAGPARARDRPGCRGSAGPPPRKPRGPAAAHAVRCTATVASERARRP